MLRVCGITHDHTINYGSSLQAYALLRVVESVELEDGTKCSYQIIPVRTSKEWLANPSLTKRLLTPIMNFYRTQFSKFDDKHLKFVPIRSIKELPALNKSVDAFMCGSDVIWNPDLNKQLNTFYLDFATKYKFSYAASFGKTEIKEEVVHKIQKPLSELDAISVREKAGVEIVKQCTSKPAQVVADPVLLLTENDWLEVFPEGKNKNRISYIFVYITHLSDPIKRMLKSLQKETGLRIIYTASGPKQAIKQGMLQVQTPEKWLQLLYDAEYIVTNSFHATAFSVLFHKKFFTVVNGDKAKGINVRMNDFLNSIGLEDRIFSDIPDQLDLSEIDYTLADKRIEEMRKESMQFLQENLEAAYQQKLEREKQS
jgi:hypothetical protein